MKIDDVGSMSGSIQDIKGEHERMAKADQLSKAPEDSLEIAEENIAASTVRLKGATAASELLKQIQSQIASQPGAALLAQANIEAANVNNLLG